MSGLTDDGLPGLFQEADQCSNSAQASYLCWVRVQTFSLLVAAAGGAATWVPKGRSFDVAGIVTLLAFLVAGGATFMIRDGKLERVWYSARALAESVKTMCWAFAVGGEPFGMSRQDSDVRADFLGRIRGLTAGLDDLPRAIAPAEGAAITTAMADLRQAPWAHRRQAYLDGRLGDQQAWYAGKAKWNESRSRRWTAIVGLLVAVGVAGAIAKITMVSDFDWFGLFSTAAAGAAGWAKLKQHDTLVSAYSVAARELSIAAANAPSDEDEAAWAAYVQDAEEAISREHTMWLASHVGAAVHP